MTQSELSSTMRWLRQTIHQAHHEGEVEGCGKNTCSAISEFIWNHDREMEKLEEKVQAARRRMDQIVATAGHPNAAEGCRIIIQLAMDLSKRLDES